MSSTAPNIVSDSAIQSVQRAATVLRSFTQTDTDLGVTTLSKQLQLHKSTVSRLLSTLEQEGFVERNPETGKYRLGLGLITLAGIVLERIDLRQVAYPHLTALAEQTQETVNVVVLDGNECMNVGGAASPRPIQYIGRVGRRTPAHCTAAGKVLLAYLNPEERELRISGRLRRFTPNTIIDRQVLDQDLVRIKAQGYAVTHEEQQNDLSAIAAPICDHTGRVCAAVVVSGPTFRVGPGEIDAFIEPLRQTARKISAQLGCAMADHSGDNRPGLMK
jgi:DNA-binding IclR family transcriptional regulator